MSRYNTKYSGTPVKKSYGVILCRMLLSNNEIEVMMVKKRVSFHYVEFVMHPYSRNDEESILRLFDNMSSDEKIDILSLEYPKMYARIWLINPELGRLSSDVKLSAERYEKYLFLKNSFEKNFVTHDGGKRLRELINRSETVDSLWEIPKGRKASPQERDLTCAVRELEEETGIPATDFNVLHDAPIVLVYNNARVKYVNTYFIALLNSAGEKWNQPRNLRINYESSQQISEISHISWMNIHKIGTVDIANRFVPMLNKLFKRLRKKYKIHKLYRLKLI